jgi:hypothetical protein
VENLINCEPYQPLRPPAILADFTSFANLTMVVPPYGLGLTAR